MDRKNIIMKRGIQILIIKDVNDDIYPLLDELKTANFNFECVSTAKNMERALQKKNWDIILSAYRMSSFSGLEVLSILKKSEIDLPFIIFSDIFNDDIIVETIKAGADDCILTNNLKRLLPAIKRELYESKARDQKRLIEQSKENEEKQEYCRKCLESLYDNVTIGLYRTTPDGKIILANKVLIKMLGFSSFEELAKRNLNQDGFELPNQRQRFLEEIEKNGEIQNFESKWLCYDHSLITVRENAKAVRDSNGNIVYYDGAVEDITKHKQIEESLRRNELNLQVILESTADGILAIDSDGKVIRANKRFAELWKIPSEILNSNDDETLLNFVLSQLVDSQQFLDKVQKLYNSKDEDKDTLFFKDGRVFERYSAPLLLDEKIIGRVWSFRDITERKKTEDDLSIYRLLFEKGTDGILVADIENEKFRYANPAMCKLLGYNKTEMLELGLTSIHPKTVLERVAREFNAQIKGDKILVLDVPCKKKDGSIVYVDINSTNIIIDGRPCLVGLFRDITQRKQAAEALRKSELRFKQIAENAQESIWEVDKNGLFTYISPVVKKQLGYEPEDIIGKKHFYDLIKPEDREKTKQAAFEIFAHKKGFRNFINNNIHKDGREVILATSGVPMLDDKNKLIGYRGVNVDITVNVQAEEQLKLSEEQYRTFFENAPIGIGISDMTGKLIAFNDAMLAPGGYSRDDILEIENVEGLYYHSSDREILISLLKEKGAVDRYPVQFKRKDGSPYDTLLSISIININNQLRIQALVEDVPERKQAVEALRKSEQQYRFLVETANEGIFVAQDANIKFTNPMMQEISEYTEEEILTIPFVDHIYPDDKEMVIANHIKRLKGELEIPRYEFRILTKSKKLKWVVINGTRIEWEGQPATLNMLTDITDFKYAEQEIKSKNEQLQKLNAEKDMLFSIIGHDLKSPFNSIIGFSDLLIEQVTQKDFEEIEKSAKIIKKSSEQTMGLLTNLIDWSRSQTGRLNYNPEHFKITHLISEIIPLYTSIAKKKSITVKKELSSDIPVYADKSMISTVLRNLISNAIKFTKQGGEIFISAKENKKEVLISVKDSGIGVPSDIIQKLFRTDEIHSTLGTENEKGTGLGLIICKEFIEKHNGEIWIESEPNKGATFSFTLPLNSKDSL